VLVYSGSIEPDADAGAYEKLFAGYGWQGLAGPLVALWTP
jgi:hypothetical protein